ncbi:MAG: hypothetical protein ACYDAO_10710 [Thermoplasmataceae archaeon]
MMQGLMTDPQRKLIFTELGKIDMSKEDIEDSLEFPIKDLTKQDASDLISGLKDKKLDETIVKIKARRTSKTDTSQNQQEKSNSEQKSLEASEPAKQSETPNVPEHVEIFGVVQIGDMEISEAGLESLKKIPLMLNTIFRNIMQKGTDYDTIPGTKSPTLLKPGAELLRMAFNLNFKTEIDSIIEDWTIGRFYYQARTHFYNKAGVYIGSGVGSANNEETKYSSRWVFESDIPEGVDKSSLKTKTKTSQYGKEYTVYLDVPMFSDKATLVNTLQKMAKKRSFVDGILSITGASRIFTQDVEDMGKVAE